MAEPWTEVLDYACDWAESKTNEFDALVVITEGVYTDIGVDHEYWGGSSHAVNQSFNLTGFFNDDWADCRDVSAFVHVSTRAIGGTETQVRMINPGSQNYWFYYKPIKPIGKDAWTTGNNYWYFHQVAWKSNVFDACLRLDKDDTERIPVNEPIDVDSCYYNDLYRTDLNGYWVPQTPKSYTTVY